MSVNSNVELPLPFAAIGGYWRERERCRAPYSSQSCPAAVALEPGLRDFHQSDLRLLGDFKGVIDLDAEIPHGRL